MRATREHTPYKEPKFIKDKMPVAQAAFYLDQSAKRHNLKYSWQRLQETFGFEDYSLYINGVSNAKPPLRYSLAKELTDRRLAPFCVGMEIELENYSDDKKAVLTDILLDELPQQHYVCYDGSLQAGIEIVTAPRTPTEIKLQYSNYYRLLEKMRKAGMTAHDNGNCGLHFHFSRIALAAKDWKALQSFLKKHKALFYPLSRRTNDRYCKYKVGTGEKYMALNLSNTNTAEFRLFRGTLKQSSFLASYEICLSLVDYFRATKRRSIQSWAKHLKKYKYADKYCQEQLSAYFADLPSPVERRRLSAEERETRENDRAFRRHQREMRLVSEATSIINDAIRPLAVQGLEYCNTINHIGDQIVGVTLPIRASGFRQELIPVLERQTAAIAALQSWANRTNTYNRYLNIRRSSGWGNSRVYASVRTA